MEDFHSGVLDILYFAKSKRSNVVEHFCLSAPTGWVDEHIKFFKKLNEFLGVVVEDVHVDGNDFIFRLGKPSDYQLSEFIKLVTIYYYFF